MLKKLLNRVGLFTTVQMAESRNELERAREYICYLEAAASGDLDSGKPIIVLGSDAYVEGIILPHGKQLIISPFARGVCVKNVLTLGRTTE